MTTTTAWKVPLADPGAEYREIAPEILSAVSGVLASGQYVMGEQVAAFEQEWAQACEAVWCVGVASGTDALLGVLRYLKENKGVRRVWVPDMTFWATAEAVLLAGLKLELVDIRSNGLMDPLQLRLRRHDAILPVSLYGLDADLAASDEYPIVLDAAHAHGHIHHTRSFASCASFYPTKNLSAVGQAGAVVTNDTKLRDWLRLWRNHGEGEPRFTHLRAAGNHRMDEMQAAVLRVKLRHLADWNKRRREIAGQYDAAFGTRRLSPNRLCAAQHDTSWKRHVYHIYGLWTDRGASSLATHLESNGIQTGRRYRPLHTQPALARDWSKKAGRFLSASAWWESVVNLPIYPQMNDRQVERVVDAVLAWKPREA